jgi:hypothetical protein
MRTYRLMRIDHAWSLQPPGAALGSRNLLLLLAELSSTVARQTQTAYFWPSVLFIGWAAQQDSLRGSCVG